MVIYEFFVRLGKDYGGERGKIRIISCSFRE